MLTSYRLLVTICLFMLFFVYWRGVISSNYKTNSVASGRPSTASSLIIDPDFLAQFTRNPQATVPDNVLVSQRDSLGISSAIAKSARHVDNSTKDYILFKLPNGTRLAVPRFETVRHAASGHLMPADPASFLSAWSRGRFIDCLGIDMKRLAGEKRKMPLSFVKDLAQVRDFLLKHHMNPVIFEGTLLGWYRECSLIPSTYDADIGVFIDEFNEDAMKELRSQKTLTLQRKLGRRNDSLEVTVSFKDAYVDVFFVYPEGNGSWVGGLDGISLDKFRYYYPLTPASEFCSGDLLGHLFNVPCNVEEMLSAEYGDWRSDRPQQQYQWNRSPKNMKNTGKWTKEEMKEVNCYYYGDKERCGIGAHNG